MSEELINELIDNNNKLADILRSMILFAQNHGCIEGAGDGIVVSVKALQAVREALYKHDILKMEIKQAGLE